MYLYVLGAVVLYFLYRWLRELPRVGDKGAKHVYITGCDSGFGNMLAGHLDSLGFSVIAGCFTEKGEEDLRRRCSSRMIATHLNVRSHESIAKVAAMIKAEVGERGALASVVFFFLIPPGVSVISRYKLFSKSASSDITGGRVHLDVGRIDQSTNLLPSDG